MQINKKIIRIFLSALLFSYLINNNAHATCSTGAEPTATINLPASINIATMPAGTPLITPLTDWISSTILAFTGCQLGSTIAFRTGQGYNLTGLTYNDGGLSYGINAFGPDNDGIGFILSTQNITNPTPTPFKFGIWTYISATSDQFYVLYRIRLIRYANISPGTITKPSLHIVDAVDNPYPIRLKQYIYTSSTSLKVQTASCTVNPTNITVQLPNMLMSQFPSIGSTSPSTPFNIVITCPNSVNVYMTITDNSNPASTSNIIAASSTSTTQGLGVQIRQNNLPISMGKDSSMAGNTNQFLIGNNISGSKTIPLTANYIRTGTVVAGQLKAVATFTMSYQ